MAIVAAVRLLPVTVISAGASCTIPYFTPLTVLPVKSSAFEFEDAPVYCRPTVVHQYNGLLTLFPLIMFPLMVPPSEVL